MRRFLAASLIGAWLIACVTTFAPVPLRGQGLPFPGPGTPAYIPKGVSFNGSTYSKFTGNLTGAAGSNTGTFSGWFNFQNDSSITELIRYSTGYLEIRRESNNKITVSGVTSGGTQVLLMTSSHTYCSTGTCNFTGWHLLTAAWNLGTTTCQLYIDGASDLAGGDTCTSGTVDWSAHSDWGNGASPSGTFFCTCYMADFYLSESFIDLSANIGKFIAGGAGVYLGPTCLLPNSSQPIVCFSGPASNWPTNLGSGGNFAVAAGTIANAPTNPP